MTRLQNTALGGCFLAIVLTATTAAAVEVGDWVAVQKDASLVASGRPVDRLLPGQVLQVLVVDQGRIWVSRGRPGWLDAGNVVPIAQAEQFFTQSLGIRQGPRGYLARGRVRLATGKVAEAMGDLRRAAELSGRDAEFLQSLGFGYLASGDQAAAIRQFSAAIAKQPKSPLGWMGRGFAYAESGQVQRAQADYNKAISLDPRHAFPRKHLAVLFHEAGRPEDARKMLEKAIELDTHDGFARKAMGRVLFDLGQLNAARDSFTIALQLDSDDREALTGRGVVRHAIGDLPGAIADYTAAADDAPETADNAFLWSNLGQAQMEAGQLQAALVHLDRAVGLDPKFTDARAHRALLFATHPEVAGSAGEAIQRAAADAAAITAVAPPESFWALRALAAVRAAEGDQAAAVELQQQAVEEVKRSGPARFVQPASDALKRYQGE
ncbi:tetratricopeptide repeat protein [Roseimaritima sediminicola]|uniref:tetratricopeptide repeat protein n=1 Tax=Roseimaritima sediminicola TaxID=2662066 RepID=UPI0012984994|nr:tetratricopeptide repeat protein [Roseimaritima sediminicola]